MKAAKKWAEIEIEMEHQNEIIRKIMNAIVVVIALFFLSFPVESCIDSCILLVSASDSSGNTSSSLFDCSSMNDLLCDLLVERDVVQRVSDLNKKVTLVGPIYD